MSSLKPVIHGRDHLPGGADPIPDLVSLVGSSLNPGQSRYECLALTVPASSSTNVIFDQTSTEGIFDLSTPTFPEALVNGAYAVAAVVEGGDGWTPGAVFTGVLSFAASYQISVRQQVVADATGHMPTFFLSQTWSMDAGNQFWIELFNEDSADRVVNIEPISALRILEYP